MRELWTVEFTLMANDVIYDGEPSLDGKMLVRGDDIHQVLKKATDRLNAYCNIGYDILTIHGARRCDPENRYMKGETENE